MHHGRKSKLITAYSALATIALGLLGFDVMRRSESGSQLLDQPAHRVFAMLPAAQGKAVKVSQPAAAQTVAAYTARRPTL